MSEKSTPPFIIRLNDETYDITRFLKNHPGGLNTLAGLNNTDIEKRFKQAPLHSDAALYLLHEYKISDTAKPYANGNGHAPKSSQHWEITSDDGPTIVNRKSNGLLNGQSNGGAPVNGFSNGKTNGHHVNGTLGSDEPETNTNTKVLDESMEVSLMLFFLPTQSKH